MRHLLLVAVLAGCGDRAVDVAAQRATLFDLTGPPSLTGNPGDQLGVSLSACPEGGVLVGAPGNKTAVLLPGGQRSPSFSFSSQFGDTVACAAGERLLLGGPGGIKTFTGNAFPTSSTSALAAHPREPFPVLAAGGQVRLIEADGGLTVLGSSGDSVTWSAKRTFAVGQVATSTVTVGELLTDGGVTGAANVTAAQALNTTGFGKQIALGDLHPEPGEELAVADPDTDRVFIYSSSGSLLMTLTGGSLGSFGESLVVEPGDAGGGLQALWVGNPRADTITRFVGDASVQLDATLFLMGSMFGAALALEPSGVLSIGAPAYAIGLNEGAVYRGPITSFVTPPQLDGVARACKLGVPCEGEPCSFGTCVGGVVCTRPFQPQTACLADAGAPDAGHDAGSPTVSPDAGAPDAGAPDAGAPDAGAPDAGAPDAGAPDAGAPDAGVADAGAADAGAADAGAVQNLGFTTSGCSTGAAVPLLGLAIVALRRRRQ